MSLLSVISAPQLIAGSLTLSVWAANDETVLPSQLPLGTCRILNLSVYAVQVLAVSIPGRIDDDVARKMAADRDRKEKTEDDDEQNDDENDVAGYLLPSTGRTLVAPAGWAFAIWGPIYLGEAMFVASQFLVDESSSLVPLIERATVPFAFAHLFQTLWCASFRAAFFARPWSKWISVVALGSTARSLFRAHAAARAVDLTGAASLVGALPLSLHLGWTTAATLVNLNGAVASSPPDDISDAVVTAVGHASVAAATAIGAAAGVVLGAPVVSGVLSWALFAVADGMKRRKVKTTAVERQRTLSLIGAFATAFATGWATLARS